ncbi:serine/threonine-protein kinase [Methanosarcina sp. Mfa9]|uniref:serine/threonine-protein kinase n=1 Tax=Methanosarcina sp. Mfa9 TaxID=3439063 RepID=UPI003F8371A2
MTRKPPLQLFLLLVLLGCMVQCAAAGSGDENPWVYEPTNDIYGMYDGINDVFWVYDPLDDVFWKLDVYNGEISGLTGYSISYSPDYDPSGSYDLFWVQGATEYEIYAYDSGSEQIFLYDSYNAAYWAYEPDPDLVWDYIEAGEMFSDGGAAVGVESDDWGEDLAEDWAEDWTVEERGDSSLSSESEPFLTNEELVDSLVWHRTENEGYFWSYAPARDFFLMYSPYNGILAVYESREDLWRVYGEPEAREVAWQREGDLGIVWIYDPAGDLFWIYYPDDEFVQGYAVSRELFWDHPVERLNFAGETSDRVQSSSAGQVVLDNPDDSSGEGGGFLVLLFIVGGMFLLKRRRSKKRANSTMHPGHSGKRRRSKKNAEAAMSPATPVPPVPPVSPCPSDLSAPSGSASNADAPSVNTSSRVDADSPVDVAPPAKDPVPPIVDAVPPVAASKPASAPSGAARQAQSVVEEGVVEEEVGLKETLSGDGVLSTVEGFPAALLSKYEPLELLGKGGFASVFKAKRKDDGEILALKIPRIDEKTSSSFIKEVAAWYNLNHPNIVRLYKSDLLPVPYLEMEYVEGVEKGGISVLELEKYPKPLPDAEALKLIRGIAAGLSHAHSRGIYHHDLKPLNVLLQSDLAPKITDFGLAKIGARNSLTTHNAYSPLYAAPEQLDESLYGKPDRRTDIYQLGMIFYELLSGKLPYSGCSMGAVLGKILSKEVKPEAISGIDPSLGRYEGIVEKMLAQEKADRYQEVPEFLSALDALERLDREEEEMKESLVKTKQTLKISTSREEIKKIVCEMVEKTAKVALLYAGVNEKPELLKALEDLRGYAGENLPELDSAISQLEYMVRNGIPVGKEFEESLKVLLGRIEGEARKE